MSSSPPEPVAAGSSSENCAHLKKLGYIAGKRVNLYGEHMILVSDPFDDGDRVAVRAVSESNPAERTIDLPITMLAGLENHIPAPPISTASKPGATRGPAGPS